MSRPLDEPKDRIWQQRRGRTPSAHEDAMGAALARIFEDGIEELDGIVARLNELGVASADGAPWTIESFQDEIARLGGKEF
jgi:hypothetical protein